MKVLIITGGNSSERKISLLSAEAVKKNLETAGHRADLFDFKDGEAKLKEIALGYDVLFPVMHGFEGEDGTLYEKLKELDKPFVGQECKGTREAFNKIISKRFLDKENIPTARWREIINGADIKKFGFPCVLKAARGGSSREVAILKSEKDLERADVIRILDLTDDFLVEQALDGVEITVGVLFDKALPPVEIIPPEGKEFDYENKYNGQTQELVGAPSLDDYVKKLAQDMALKIHQDLKIDPYSRTDFVVVNDKPIVLEVNPPNGVGLTTESLFPKEIKAEGISYPEFVDMLVQKVV